MLFVRIIKIKIQGQSKITDHCIITFYNHITKNFNESFTNDVVSFDIQNSFMFPHLQGGGHIDFDGDPICFGIFSEKKTQKVKQGK